MGDSTRIVISGVSGRMGGVLTRLIKATEGFTIEGGLVSEKSQYKGRDIGELANIREIGMSASTDLSIIEDADAVIDFSAPDATIQLLEAAQETKTAFVIGTTGFSANQEEIIRKAAYHSPIVKSENMSVALNILAKLTQILADQLPDDWDIEILEKHHSHKKDAPSGTSLLLGEAAAEGRNIELPAPKTDRSGARKKGEIGFASLRLGGIICEHDVMFADENERLVLAHTVGTRDVFARGALNAAYWVRNRPAQGIYGMDDVLDIKDFQKKFIQ